MQADVKIHESDVEIVGDALQAPINLIALGTLSDNQWAFYLRDDALSVQAKTCLLFPKEQLALRAGSIYVTADGRAQLSLTNDIITFDTTSLFLRTDTTTLQSDQVHIRGALSAEGMTTIRGLLQIVDPATNTAINPLEVIQQLQLDIQQLKARLATLEQKIG